MPRGEEIEVVNDSWTYVLLCLVIPVVWGVVSARVFDRWQAWLRRSRPDPADRETEEPVDMYYI